MDAVVNSIIRFLINNKAIDHNEDEVAFYKYGIEISLSSIIGISLILLLGFILNNIPASLIYLSMFILIRTITGGFHASTYIKCNLLTSTGFILVFVLFVINYNILNDKTTKDEIMLFTALLIIFLILIKKEEVKT